MLMRSKTARLEVFVSLIIFGLIVGWSLNVTAAEPIKIGVVFSYTGPLGSNCKITDEGLDVAVEMVNKKGGVLGRPIETIKYDDKTRPEEGPTQVKKLINVDKVKLITGGMGSSIVLAMKEVLRREDSLFFVSVARTPTICESGISNIFMVNTNIDYDTASFRSVIANQFKPKTVAFLGDIGDLTLFDLTKMKADWGAPGKPRLVATDQVELNTTDFTIPLTKIKAVNPDAIYLSMTGHALMGASIKQARELGIKATIFAAPGLLTMPGVTLAGRAAEGAITMEPYLPGRSLEEMKPLDREFNIAFKTKYGRIPDKLEVLGFDSIYILARAIEKVGTATDIDKIAKTLRANKWDSPMGGVTFDSIGRAERPQLIVVIKGGKKTQYQTK